MKRFIFLSLFLFGWLLILESCDKSCDEEAVCFLMNGLESDVYDENIARLLMAGDSVSIVDLHIGLIPMSSYRFCLMDLIPTSTLMALSPCSPSLSLDDDIQSYRIISNARVGTIEAGFDISEMMTFWQTFCYGSNLADLPISKADCAEEPKELDSFIRSYNYRLPIRLHGDIAYGEQSAYRDYFQFKDGVEIEEGLYNFTIELTLNTGTTLATTTSEVYLR